ILINIVDKLNDLEGYDKVINNIWLLMMRVDRKQVKKARIRVRLSVSENDDKSSMVYENSVNSMNK
ncbi:6646_t:CDS:2, partial [Gigaspora margarita]